MSLGGILVPGGMYPPSPDLGNAGDCLWLSAPKPITPPGTPFAPDLQSWIRNDGPGALSPDWERIGDDVTHQGPFNASFSLSGTVVSPVPAPPAVVLVGLGASCVALRRYVGCRATA
jgi:hypothetical protein